MSTASQRLTTTRSHLRLPNMAAASNFYSIVAGVGAGTGRYVLFSLRMISPRTDLNIVQVRSIEVRKDISRCPSCPQPGELRIYRKGDQSRRWTSNRDLNRCFLRILRQECLRRNPEGI
jgi:hypothetical protein